MLCSLQIVIVFKGNPIEGLSWEYQSLEGLIPNCQGCMVADSVYKLYMAVKKATNDFEVAKKAVKVRLVWLARPPPPVSSLRLSP